MNFELFVARRYLTAKRKQAFISVITFISVLGITIGVMALVIAIALITGFQSDVQDKILGSTSHIMVSSVSSEGIGNYEQLMAKIKTVPGVIQATPVVNDTVLLRGPYKSDGALLRGIDFEMEKESSPWLRELESGNVPSREDRHEGIVLGRELAIRIGAGIGDGITVLTSPSRLSPVGLMPRMKKFAVTGIFYTGLYEFDSTMAFIDLDVAQGIFKLDEKISLIHIRIDDIFRAPEIRDRLIDILPLDTYATTWMELNKPLFSALKLEKNLMFFTITLIVLVAALNIIATLILMVMEKTRDIGILKAMGANSKSILKIFFLQGAMIGVVGTFVGTILGLIWCWIANTFELIKVPVDIYPIAFVPFRIKILDLAMIVGVTLLISFLSTLFPSYRASKVDPVVALKYE